MKKGILPIIAGLYCLIAPSLGYAQLPLAIQQKQPENHYVTKQKGITLADVGRKNYVPLEDVVACNPSLKPDSKLKKGQDVKLFDNYYVKFGDTLSQIRESKGVTLSEILDYNQIEDPDKIYAGSWLRIPCTKGEKRVDTESERGERENQGIHRKESKGKYVIFPSGLKLYRAKDQKGTLTGKGKEFYDPNESGNPLLEVPRDKLFKNVSPHFRLAEFAEVKQTSFVPSKYVQNLGGDTYYRYIRLSPEYVKALEKLRAKAGRLDQSSGYRSYGYNHRLYTQVYGKNATNSRHSSGDGGDIRLSYRRHKKALERIFKNGGLGIDHADRFVHVDTRGKKARWSYN